MVVFAGLVSLMFRFRHCCVYRGIDFFWFVRDILIYYQAIPAEVGPAWAAARRCCGL
jgi:hypothetical protein